MNIETANRLFQYRKKHNFSQEELAEKIGVSRQAVSKWERAEASPDTDNLLALAKIYGVTLDELLQGANDAEVKQEESPQSVPNINSEAQARTAESDDEDEVQNKSLARQFPVWLFSLAFFLAWGFSGACYGFGLSWICFLAIPLYDSLIDAFTKKKPNHFAYPVVCVVIYILMGYLLSGGWAIGWVVFLTIPIYYFICMFFKRNKTKEDQ